MTIADILTPDRVELSLCCASKKRALEKLSELLSTGDESLAQRAVFNGLCARERLGSTAMGEGVALPHCRMPGLERALGAMLRMESPVEFDAPDGRPVDLVFGLAVPETCTDEHLAILAKLAETFSDGRIRDGLRGELDTADAFSLVNSGDAGGDAPDGDRPAV